jgi:energy-coupling factor transporter ATP-binding protein EcfA2
VKSSAARATRWGPQAFEPKPRSIVALIRTGTLDAELAALLWLLLESRLPILVAAGPQGAGKSTLLNAALEFLPPGTERIVLQGHAEDFVWLPEAASLGWRTGSVDAGARTVTATDPSAAQSPASPSRSYLVATELSQHLPWYTWGGQARVAIRALSLGYGLASTIHAESLEEVLDELSGPGVGLGEDELSHLGVVLILKALPGAAPSAEPRRRIVAAHYVRPLARDVHGHNQRLGPAVLATWNERSDSFEHFAWGVLPELAERTGRRAGDFEVEHGRRTDYLRGLAEADVSSVEAVRTAIDGYRAQSTAHHH